MSGRVLVSLTLATMLAASGSVRADDSFRAFRDTLIEYFEPQGYVPVIVDRGYKIGDVIMMDGVGFYARGTRCFPHLKMPPPVNTTLPNAAHVYDIGMSFGLKLRQLFSSRAGVDLVRRVEIKFTDVKDVSVPLLDLREALDTKACPEIVPLVQGTMTSLKPGQETFFVVSELLLGTREARLDFAKRADLKLKTDTIARLLTDSKLNVEASNDGGVILKTLFSAPIAMKPVTIPHVVKVYSFEDLRGGQAASKVTWQPADCHANNDCSEQFSPFADLVNAAEPNLSPAELNQ